MGAQELRVGAIFDTKAVAIDRADERKKLKKRKSTKGQVDRSETFDEFVDRDGLLAKTENAAIKDIIADRIKVAMDK